MTTPLRKHEFTEADWPEVQSFDCGDQPSEREVSRWLTGGAEEDSALRAIRDKDRPAKVWLYKLEDGTLVGFAATAKTHWRWRGKKDPKVPVTILIWLGVDVRFRGLPAGSPDGTYAAQILSDVAAEAVEEKEEYPVLGLCVQEDNARAIRFYEREGFAGGLEPFVDKTTGVRYRRMAVILDDEALLRLRNAANN